ncbi:transcriptional regulator [Trebonia kvetii]|uniref:Transcriptional regulator n=2 Tax=Trebonia kvetii TaxID=2480626 RepID=A0A6P2C7M6_9ACTN|nr:transcriptional regulator [Trebonia kvetii]
MDSAGPDSEQLLSGLEDSAGDAAVLRMRLGNQLRRLREAAGISPEEAGFEIRGSRSKISRLENGRVKLKNRDVTDLLLLYGVTDEVVLSKFLALVMQSNGPDWWGEYGDILPGWLETYLGLEAAATIIRTCEAQFVHGLFQTADYARAVIGLGRNAPPEDEIERWVSLFLRRQELLSRPDPPNVWSVMDEAVLRRPAGAAPVMRAQFRHLIEVAKLPCGPESAGNASTRPDQPPRKALR